MAKNAKAKASTEPTASKKPAPGTIFGVNGYYHTDLSSVISESAYRGGRGNHTQPPIITEYAPVRRFRMKSIMEEVK